MFIKDKAQKYIKQFTVKTREDGSSYYFIDKDSGGLYDAIYKAHGDRFPDDFIYSTFLHLLEVISEYEIRTASELEDLRGEIVDNEVDVYTSGLTKWLNSDNRNVYYLTEVMEEYQPTDGFQLLSMAQYKAIDEVMEEVINLLSK